MPIVKASTKSKELKNTLQLAIEQYGLDRLQSALSDLKVVVAPVTSDVTPIVTLEQVRQFYLSSGYYLGLAPESRRGYKYEFGLFIKHVAKFCKAEPTLEQLMEPILIKDYLENYKTNKSTYSRKCGFLSAFFRVTVKHFYKDTIEDLKPILKALPMPKDEIPKALTVEQINEVVELSQSNYRNFVIVMTFLSSGIRLCELARLRIADILNESPTFYVIAKGRGGFKQKRHISALGYTILTDYVEFTFQSQKSTLPYEEYRDLFVFSANRGKSSLSNRAIQSFVKDYIRRATTIPEDKKNDYCVHTFRHCFSVYALDSGIDIYTLSRLLGHCDVKTTSVYLKLFTQQLKAAIEKHPFAKGINNK
ncbi:tyrosine-type recombinase/integrase [Paenibacillus sp. R14(2021)]|uniref:tyrosine-type recombinase/integrase n=1 Tax=Paenibacillus sp. R14(2021) TaxID=2859228 RepID=UPI001C612A02|nr:tyrosine-type recombinase/integrase [Paenibacillus sp. R14(2021)]